MHSVIPVFLTAALISGCSLDSTVPSHTDFHIGDSRAEISRTFGTPDRTNTLQKSDEQIWGAIESFWDTIPMGSTVEIWSYRSETPNGGKGETELYFIDGSSTVNGIAFSPEGAVYESDNSA